MGIFDKLFGEKVEITFTDENGIERSKKVLKSDLEQWERDGRISEMKAVRTNISGIRGRIEEWTIGVHVEKEAVNDFLDESTGELYVVEAFEKGVPKQTLVHRDTWEKLQRELASIDQALGFKPR
jgi:hypothetical protein